LSEDEKIVSVKLKRGDWEVDIKCPESKVKKIVDDVISGIDKNTKNNTSSNIPAISKSVTKHQTRKKYATCRELLDVLYSDSWFSSERTLSEVHEELARRGYNYDKTSISHSLVDMVKETILTRVGSMRNYRYIQKRPPT
jgi:hypothetical protein